MEEPQNRSTGPATQAPWLRVATWVVGLVVVGSVAFLGLRIGQTLLGEGPIEGLGGELHQIQTATGTYVGTITAVQRGYLVLAQPAVVTAQASQEGDGTEFLVESLAGEPYGISGAIAIREDQVIHVGSVAPSSGMAGAYRAATNGQPEPDADP